MTDTEAENQLDYISSSNIHQFLTFRLGNETYAFDILNIKEIIAYGNITVVPMVPDFIAGVINLRGSVVPVIDLASRFGKTNADITKRTSILIMEMHDDDTEIELGVIVHYVNEVVEIEDQNIEPAPSFGTTISTDYIAGMGKIDDKFLILLEIQRVLSIDELAVLGSDINRLDAAIG